ncbi:hypothetical protein COL940_001531 [Colletotrichum noveboracense]|nr:hypothetical protein COL940_001531 [Colletotrichum noveboracense]
MDFIRPALPPIHVDTSLFRGGQKARDTDIFIAVMGLAGSGKSTFVSHLTKASVPIGSKLQSCTREVTVYRYQYSNSTNVYLVDTPGFDDTNLSDSDVLKEIATWLTGSYNNEVKLTGILYLHRITDPRMGGSARKNLFMFKKLCGPEALKHVVLVTTMWELVDERTGLERQTELETTEDFWVYMLSKGSRIEKHMNNPQSAHHIISRFMSHSRPTTPVLLAIQDEMVNKNKNLDETEAGKGLEGEAIAARDKESQEELMRQQALAERNLERLRRQQEEIKTTMEKLHREKYEKLEADWKKMEAKNNKKEAQWVQEKEELNGFASRIWWGFEGSYVMEMQDTTMVMNLRGHYGTLGETLLQKTNVKIKELAMDIHGGKAFALIMEDKTVKFETSGKDSNWDVAFKEYVTVNFGLRWA